MPRVQSLGERANRLPALGALMMMLLPAGISARAEDLTFGDTAVHTASRSQFHADLQHLSGVIAACRANATACDPGQVGDDERILTDDRPDAPVAFEMHWSWLRSTLHTAQTAKADDRARYMREAQEQIDSMARETVGGAQTDVRPQGAADPFPAARSAADSVLRSPEFEHVTGTTWWDRLVARIQNVFARMLNGVSDLGSAAPWLGKLLEWLLFLTAAVGLLIFLLRSVARQRMKLALGHTAPAATAWTREADDWARQAEIHAADAEWREAIHCLYWAAIVQLEARRAWRHNPTRTPREYIRLLKPGSPQQQGLRGLTWLLERLWYGQREANAVDFERAQGCFRQLSADASAPAARTTSAEATA